MSPNQWQRVTELADSISEVVTSLLQVELTDDEVESVIHDLTDASERLWATHDERESAK